ncbi:glycoside hydrolase family 43 [Micromonospora globispora]|uniref:glycoside hydrolase family 43 protein n=1 Tax=Micromonospora globispora TaxID=1450148 RepID=UPI000D6F234B|nr:glycoside hydrolase family 43 protein [Micromonospora globispora]PWU61595.1 glycoside hydrolase family 43 [Micromonospora globispora]RQW82247.1 glycoside hydrolase family 43 [Micromonospora globispora]
MSSGTRWRRDAAALAAALLVAGCGSGETPSSTTEDVHVFTNPVIRSDAPDPQAIRVDESWYLFHTNSGGRNVPVLTSPDLVEWTEAGDALPELPGWADAGKNWAPEAIELAPDRFLLYYTVADRSSGRQCVGRAVADKPLGPYRDGSTAPLICQAELGGSIDASPYRDTDGSLWLLWKNDGNAMGVDTWLWSQRLSPDGLRLVGEPTKLLKQTEPWEGNLVEGPFFHRHDGRLFLFFAANAYDKDTYAEGYAVCESPTGPCVKAPENPILKTNAAASGPGHASIVEKDGRTWLLYHAWPPGQEGSTDPGRQVWLDEVVWQNGKPVVKGPTAEPQPHP